MPTPNFYYNDIKYNDMRLLSRYDFFKKYPETSAEEYNNTLEIFIEERR